jgi:hypothetical protein
LNQKTTSAKLDTYFDKKQATLFKIKIIGIIVLIIGCIFFLNSIILGFNIAVTLILIGIFIVFLPSKKNITDNRKDIFVIGFIIIWTILVLFLTIHFNLEILFVLSFLGILIINEVTHKISSESLKLRLNIFIFSFFLLFIIIVLTKIINY